MVFNAKPPENWFSIYSYDDWLRLLAIHEYTHFLNMDPTVGYAQWLRVAFSDVAPLPSRPIIRSSPIVALPLPWISRPVPASPTTATFEYPDETRLSRWPSSPVTRHWSASLPHRW